MENHPKVTVVTVCYNSQDVIEKTILSVIHQTYPHNLEYIIIDGGSKDGTVDVIRKYESKISKWISEPDGGVYFAMNKAIKLAHGEWINFMNAGDSFCSNHVLASCFENKDYGSDIALICGDTICVFPWSNYLRKGQNSDGTFNFCHQSVFTRTRLLKEEPYDTFYRIIADNVWYQNLLRSSFKLEYIAVAVANYEGYSGISAKNGVRFYIEHSRSKQVRQNVRWKLSVLKLRLKLKMQSLIPRSIRDKVWERELNKTLIRLNE